MYADAVKRNDVPEMKRLADAMRTSAEAQDARKFEKLPNAPDPIMIEGLIKRAKAAADRGDMVTHDAIMNSINRAGGMAPASTPTGSKGAKFLGFE